MRLVPTAVCILALLCAPVVAGQHAGRDDQPGRLVSLGRLWATIKYFHPGVSESTPGDWDAALLEAIPQVRAAHSREEYAAAVRGMLSRLDDPVTRLGDDAPAATTAAYGFASVEPRGRILLVTSGRVSADPLDTAATVRKYLGDVDSVIFDLRPGAVHPWLWDARWFSNEPLPYPSHRFRLHVGNVSIRGAEGNPFFSGIVTRTAPLSAVPPSGATRKRVVFVVRDGSELPLLAAALQDAGHGWIVSERPIDDRAFARHGFARHYKMPLGESLTAYIRTSEMLHPDGTVGLVADAVAPADAVTLAFEAARQGIPRAKRRRAESGYQVKAAELSYSETPFPSESLRLLAVFRAWATFEWLYPYRSLIQRDWQEVLEETIPKVLAAKDALAYHLAIAEMVAHVGDTHAVVESSQLNEFWGPATPALSLRPVEGRAVVVAVTDPSAESGDVSVGDVVLSVDGQAAESRLATFTRYISASTPQALRRDAVNRLLRGPQGSHARIRLLKQDGTERETVLERRREFLPRSWAPVVGQVVRVLPGNIGYIDLRLLQPHEVDMVFEHVKSTAAIIFDMRGYPNNTRLAIAAKLTDRTRIEGATISTPIAFEPGTQTVQSSRVVIELTPAAAPYRGRTVMLIDDRAQSQAEATAQMVRAVHGTIFVGSATTGANGEGSNFSVPGGIEIGLTATAVSKLDGTQLQRIGVTPDIEVHPTIAGIRAGRDEVLERAVQYLRSNAKQ